MDITLGKIINAYVTLQELCVQKTDPKISYWIMRNTRELKSHCIFFEEERMKIYNKYLFLKDGKYASDVNGVIVFNYKDETTCSDFEKEMNELLSFVCDNVSTYKLSSDNLLNSTLQISADNLDNIDFLLQWNDKGKDS